MCPLSGCNLTADHRIGLTAHQTGSNLGFRVRELLASRKSRAAAAGVIVRPCDGAPECRIAVHFPLAFRPSSLPQSGRLMYGEWEIAPLPVDLGMFLDPAAESWIVMVFDAHAQAFTFLGGVPRRGIYDNLKPAVDAIFMGKQRRYNRRFLVMCNHYLIEPTACTPEGRKARSRIKSVMYARGSSRRSFAARILNSSMSTAPLDACSSPANAIIRIFEVWQEEHAQLRTTPAPFDGFGERTCRISSTCLMQFERNRYSVEYRCVGRVMTGAGMVSVYSEL